MKISLDWLQDFIELKEKDHQKIRDIITANSAEVETMEGLGDHLNKVVVGLIKEVKPHPDADKLRICMVDDGSSELVQIVCGGSNLEEGQKIALAKLDAVVKWHGTDTVKMKKAKIRGEYSYGMICASEEIGLDEMFPKATEKEIMDISAIDAKPGTPLAKALKLDDTVIDIDNHAITHRADLFSHKGFAREFIANKLGSWKKADEKAVPTDNSPAPIEVKIADKEVCSKYAGVYITGVEIADSPDWMKARLAACGVRPINNIVDITNYVMLELGMPTHAYDLEQVKGRKWTMRKSKKGEKVITLDEVAHELPDDIIVIDDGNELIDLCGIMGGFNSGIKPSTNKVWLHAPVYHPTLVRKARIGLGHISDAAIVYEKGVDTELAMEGLSRAAELILELCPGAKIASAVTDIQNVKPEKQTLELRSSQIKRLAGFEVKDTEVERILSDLGFETKKSSDGWDVDIPTFRQGDVQIEADLIEEIARIYGYDNVPFDTPLASIAPVAKNPKREVERYIKNELVSLGFNEIYTFSFQGPELIEKTGLKVDDSYIELENPISSEVSIMRQSLLPWTLEVIEDNLRYKNQFRIFELSNVYKKEGQKVTETPQLIIATVGEDFRSLQGALEHMGLGLKPAKPSGKQEHPGRYAEVTAGNKSLGEIYELHPSIKKNFDIKAQVIIAEIDVAPILELDISAANKYQEIPKFPAVQLDVSVAIPAKELAEKFHSAIQKTDDVLISDIQLIDEYAGQNIEEGKRALTYSITYQAKDRTLTDDEVQAVHQKVIKNLKGAGGAIR